MTTISIDTQQIYGYPQNHHPSAFVLTWDKNLTNLYTRRSASIVESINYTLDLLLSKNIIIEDKSQIENFLIANTGIVAYLHQVPEKIYEYFENSKSKIDISYDPDNINEPSEIFLEIETHLSPVEANATLSRLNQEWILASEDRDLMSLNITLSFI